MQFHFWWPPVYSRKMLELVGAIVYSHSHIIAETLNFEGSLPPPLRKPGIKNTGPFTYVGSWVNILSSFISYFITSFKIIRPWNKRALSLT